MLAFCAFFLIASFLPGQGTTICGRSFLYQPAYCLDEIWLGPAEPYAPQPGDIYFATDRSRIIQMGHRLATSGAPHHSGIVVATSDGLIKIMESGPFNSLRVEIVDWQRDLDKHLERGEKVWIRRRRVPLTSEESAKLTAWAEAQNHKRFAAGRMLLQMTPCRCRGPLRTYCMGYPRGEHNSYFCSELVLETCVHIGLLPAQTTRPICTYPRDLFFDDSPNPYLHENCSLACWWFPPARWTNCPSAPDEPQPADANAGSPRPGLVFP